MKRGNLLSTYLLLGNYARRSRSHAPRGNAVFDALRRQFSRWREAAERPGRHSHAEHGNEITTPVGPVPSRPTSQTAIPPRRGTRRVRASTSAAACWGPAGHHRGVAGPVRGGVSTPRAPSPG